MSTKYLISKYGGNCPVNAGEACGVQVDKGGLTLKFTFASHVDWTWQYETLEKRNDEYREIMHALGAERL